MSDARRLRVLSPGSFDPIHLGHLDVIEQASELFGSVVVAVMYNHAKTGGQSTFLWSTNEIRLGVPTVCG